MDVEAPLMELFAQLGVVTRTVRHAPVFTAAEAQTARDEMPGGHAKTLFLEDKAGQLALVVAHEDGALDLNQTAKRLGLGRVSFGAAALMQEVLGVAPGSVTPFALFNAARHPRGRAMRVVFDARLQAAHPLWFHPLHNGATSSIARADLERFATHLGFAFRWMALPLKQSPLADGGLRAT
jgi:Ala-tRNA(Pro) deacylase